MGRTARMVFPKSEGTVHIFSPLSFAFPPYQSLFPPSWTITDCALHIVSSQLPTSPPCPRRRLVLTSTCNHYVQATTQPPIQTRRRRHLACHERDAASSAPPICRQDRVLIPLFPSCAASCSNGSPHHRVDPQAPRRHAKAAIMDKIPTTAAPRTPTGRQKSTSLASSHLTSGCPTKNMQHPTTNCPAWCSRSACRSFRHDTGNSVVILKSFLTTFCLASMFMFILSPSQGLRLIFF
jgi:hypothetical protein